MYTSATDRPPPDVRLLPGVHGAEPAATYRFGGSIQ